MSLLFTTKENAIYKITDKVFYLVVDGVPVIETPNKVELQQLAKRYGFDDVHYAILDLDENNMAIFNDHGLYLKSTTIEIPQNVVKFYT